MRIAIINPWSISKKSVGGTERFVMDLAEALHKKKNEVDVYMFSGENHILNGISYININLLDIDGEADEYMLQEHFGKFDTDDAYDNLARLLESKIDVTKYDFIQLNSLLFLQAWRWKKRVFTIHTNPFEYELAWGKTSYTKCLEIMKRYKENPDTIFVAPSKFYAELYNELTNCKIEYIPHAIDISRLETQSLKEKIIHKYSLAENRIHIIVPSRLEPIQKQPMLLLDACCLLPQEMKEQIEIIYTGLDKQYIKFVDELKNKAKENSIIIHIIRFDKMAEVYKIGDFTVLPSKSESFGYSALESLSLGIPTILNSIPTFLEISTGNENAYLFNNSTVELKDLIAKFIEQNDFKRAIPPFVWSEQYSMNSFANNYLKLI